MSRGEMFKVYSSNLTKQTETFPKRNNAQIVADKQDEAMRTNMEAATDNDTLKPSRPAIRKLTGSSGKNRFLQMLRHGSRHNGGKKNKKKNKTKTKRRKRYTKKYIRRKRSIRRR